MDIIFGQQTSFEYVNYKGIKSTRNVIPMSLRFGSTKYHTENQWLLVAYDIDKLSEREFALNDMLVGSSVDKVKQLCGRHHELDLMTQYNPNPIWVDATRGVDK